MAWPYSSDEMKGVGKYLGFIAFWEFVKTGTARTVLEGKKTLR